MKKIKLSMVAIVTMSMFTYSNASNLRDALTNGKISGAIQAYYFARDKDSGTDNDITTLGLDLSYETATYNGFGLKGTFQSSTSPWIDEDGKAARKSNMWGSGAQLSEMYLSYAFGNTKAKIGRMYFWSPLMGGSSSRVNKESFQGISLVNSDIKDTIVTIAYMNKFQSRTDGTGDIGKFTKIFKTAASPWSYELEDGAYTVSIANKSIENLKLTASYLDAIDTFQTAYIEATYKIDNFSIAGQYYNSKEDGHKTGTLFGIKADANLGSFSLLAAYTTTGDKVNVIPGLGNGADMAYTWSEVFAYQYAADLDSYKVAGKYKINSNTYVGTSYLKEDGRNYTYGYTALTAGHNFSGEFAGLNITAAYEMGSKDASDDELRVRLNYKF